MLQSLRELFSADPEAHWRASDVSGSEGANTHFKNWLRRIVEVLCRETSADHGYAAISGIECGQYTPVVAVGRKLSEIAASSTMGTDTVAARHLGSADDIVHILDPANDVVFKGEPDVAEKLQLKLRAHGEVLGFICLDCRKPNSFSPEIVAQVEDVLPELVWRIGEQVFSLRVHNVATPFRPVTDPRDLCEMFEEIVDNAVRGFASDGVVLRTYDDAAQGLVVRAHRGDSLGKLLSDRFAGEGLCGRVFLDKEHGWALAEGLGAADLLTAGVSVDETERKRLAQAGVQSCLVMRLDSSETVQYVGLGEKKREPVSLPVGTLSFFHRRPNHYSWRDVALFRAYCRRVADAIALQYQTARLLDSHDNLQFQNLKLTQTEVFALLAHDLFHKSFAACTDLDTYVRQCRKLYGDRSQPRGHVKLEPLAEKALESAVAVQRQLSQIRTLMTGGPEEFERLASFSLLDLVTEIGNTLSGAIDRAKISMDIRIGASITLFGARLVLEQVLYNLFINSIDAIKSRKTSKPSAIHLHAHEEPGGTRRVVIHFWDDGPGINRAVFRKPDDVFTIGRTTKPTGTGTGLPVARTLLSRHFQGNLVLEDMETARFRIEIPNKLRGST